MRVEEIAQVAHELNKAYCESIGDNSQPSWDEAPEWQKSSAINGVKFHLENPQALPSASHESWLKQKEEEGWIYGPVKDAAKKEHPCFLPYDELPTDQKAKDFIFRQAVHSLRKTTGYATAGRGLTFGERVVGINFNPSQDPQVFRAKQICAELVDMVRSEVNKREAHHDIAPIESLLFDHAVAEILNAQMNAVKVLTFSLSN